ncbi:MAG: LacI family transcriptional regulator [Lachnospiraceae bacterium]|nr:LacI family transcriptional regulator [Lachnospiraceae bacterium]
MTIKDIAKKAGVSTATVSYVINGTKNVLPEKRQRVLDVIAKTGYQPNQVAKSLRTRKTSIIGVLVEDIMAFPTSSIINGISEYMEQTEYNILLSDLRMMDSLYNQYDHIVYQQDKINKAITFLNFGAKVDAIIYVGMFDRDISGVITSMNKPIVVAYSISRDDYVCSVTYENEEISTQLTKHLIDAGHKHIAVITGIAHTPPAQLRLKGIQKAFKDAGMILDNALVKNGDWERRTGYACMQELLAQAPLPTAVIAMNDLMAVGAIDAVREAGLRVPEDVSVIGFDNREISEFVYPKLTTAEIDLKAIGFTAAQVAAQKLSEVGEYAEKRRIIIPCNLIERDTVARLSNT